MDPSSSPLRTAPTRALLTDRPQEILQFSLKALDRGRCSIAFLSEIRGGAARSIGAMMAVGDDGRYCGFVSGGCVEAAVAAEAVEAIAHGRDRKIMLGRGSPFLDLQMPCGGGLTVHIHVLENGEPIRRALALLARREPCDLVYDQSEQKLAIGVWSGIARWQQGFFKRPLRPEIRVIVAGRSIEAAATANLARASGFDVITLEDLRWASHTQIPDADTAIALLCHDLEDEAPLLKRALASEAFYIGALGGRETHRRRCVRLREDGWSDGVIERIRAPIGLFHKGRDAASIALSVLSEIAATRQGTESSR